MISADLKQALDEYIGKNYVLETPEYIPEIRPVGEITKGVGELFPQNESFKLSELVDEVGETFHEMLFFRIDMSGMTDVEVYKRANLDRKLFSKIRSNPAYHPRKQTVLALSIALKLSLDDTVDLLARAEYALSPGNKGDLIIRYFIEHGIYDIIAINYALDEYEQPLLG